jgi:hypothetical protein
VSLRARHRALVCALVLVVQAYVAFGVLPEQSGYVTGAPMLDWFGLATLGGRDAVQLADGCVGVKPGVNVVLDDSGDLQVMDPVVGLQPDQCVISRRVHMSDVPCATNPAGACDVAFS